MAVSTTHIVGPTDPIRDLRGGAVKAVATAGTRVQLTTTRTEVKGVFIQALAGNTNAITVGGSDVVGAAATQVGIALVPGASVYLSIDDLSKVWLDSITNNDKVSYMPVV